MSSKCSLICAIVGIDNGYISPRYVSNNGMCNSEKQRDNSPIEATEIVGVFLKLIIKSEKFSILATKL